MKLGWFSMALDVAPGAANTLLADLARAMAADGLRLAGAVQENTRPRDDCACDMDLRMLGMDHPLIRISQTLGAGSSGCRLDPDALEQAAALIAGQLAKGGIDMVILTKFGKQESLGRGFRQVIAQALEAGVPVILHVPQEHRNSFADFTGDFADEVTPAELGQWCREAIAGAAA